MARPKKYNIDKEQVEKLASFGSSPNNPNSNSAFPSKVSFNWAIVIRLGKACGFTIISGVIPRLEKGISS